MIQDAQFLANQIIEKIKQEISVRDIKGIGIDTLKEELSLFIQTLKSK